MKTFVVQPTGGGQPFELQAETAEYDQSTGATLFKNGDDLVARQLNVSFHEKPAATASK